MLFLYKNSWSFTTPTKIIEPENLVKLDTLLHLCEGLGISIKKFFDDPIFEDVEQD